MPHRCLLPLLLGALLAACAAAAGPEAAPPPAAAGPAGEETLAPTHRERLHWVPVATAEGTTRLIQMRLCRPAAPAQPAALAVVNHGSPPNAAARPGMQPSVCTAEAVAWFLRRGHAVALPLRRGYGASGGGWAEAYGRCDTPDFHAAGLETARDIAAAIAYARALPEIGAGVPVLVVGQSAGGWGTMALASRNPPEVAALVNFAGGRGGWAGNQPNVNCAPDRLVADAGRYGATARGVPMLWIYAANDSFFEPRLASAMHQAFTHAGGQARLEAMPNFARDGHGLFFGREGSAVWGPVVEAYLRERGLPAAVRTADAAGNPDAGVTLASAAAIGR